MISHHLRDELVSELHNRPFPKLRAPVSISHMVVLEPTDLLVELGHIEDLAQRYCVSGPAENATCYYQDFGHFEFRWERHTEFSSYIVIIHSVSDRPFAQSAMALLPEDWLANVSGAMISGDHIEMRENVKNCPSVDRLHEYFEGQNIIASELHGGATTLRTSVRNHQAGFGRILIYTDNTDLCDSGRLVRTLIELAAYRTLTLLALPIARGLIPVISSMEQVLAEITERITEIGGFDDEKALLEQLSEFAADLEKLISDNSFRFAATEAYYQLCQDRLAELEESTIANLNNLKQFYYRRFRPGFSTCQSVRQRMQSLSDRVSRASSLLRARVDLTLESQNQNLLRSMDSRAKLQLRMQQTVEGLSIVAISHYVLSLLGHLLRGIPHQLLPVGYEVTLATATPVVLILAWFSVRRIKRQFLVTEK